MNCAICGRPDADMECKPTVHPVYANEWVHEDCLREEEDAINRDLCREMQNALAHLPPASGGKVPPVVGRENDNG